MKLPNILLMGLAIYACVNFYKRYEDEIISDLDDAWCDFKKMRRYHSEEENVYSNSDTYDITINEDSNEKFSVTINGVEYDNECDMIDALGIDINLIKEYKKTKNCSLREAIKYFIREY